MADYVDIAMHCIGLDHKKPYNRHGKMFYKPYRNYFSTAPECSDFYELEMMTLAGYMKRSKMSKNGGYNFWLTRKGLDWLGKELNITIYGEED